MCVETIDGQIFVLLTPRQRRKSYQGDVTKGKGKTAVNDRGREGAGRGRCQSADCGLGARDRLPPRRAPGVQLPKNNGIVDTATKCISSHYVCFISFGLRLRSSLSLFPFFFLFTQVFVCVCVWFFLWPGQNFCFRFLLLVLSDRLNLGEDSVPL